MRDSSGMALAVGRFAGWEPLGFEAGDENWYRFVANGPAVRTDPSGLLTPSEVLRNATNELTAAVKAGKITADEAWFRLQILRNALERKVSFEEPNAYRNPEFWTDYGDPDRDYTVRRGKKPHEAVEDIWKTGARTGCRKATDLTVIKSYIDYLRWKHKDSKQDLANQLAELDKYIGYREAPKSDWFWKDPIVATDEQNMAGGLPDSAFLPGDNVHFKNPFYAKHPGHGLEGSNVFYAGDGVYVGYDGQIWESRMAVQGHMDPWVPGSQNPSDFPSSTINTPKLP